MRRPSPPTRTIARPPQLSNGISDEVQNLLRCAAATFRNTRRKARRWRTLGYIERPQRDVQRVLTSMFHQRRPWRKLDPWGRTTVREEAKYNDDGEPRCTKQPRCMFGIPVFYQRRPLALPHALQREDARHVGGEPGFTQMNCGECPLFDILSATAVALPHEPHEKKQGTSAGNLDSLNDPGECSCVLCSISDSRGAGLIRRRTHHTRRSEARRRGTRICQTTLVDFLCYQRQP